MGIIRGKQHPLQSLHFSVTKQRDKRRNDFSGSSSSNHDQTVKRVENEKSIFISAYCRMPPGLYGVQRRRRYNCGSIRNRIVRHRIRCRRRNRQHRAENFGNRCRCNIRQKLADCDRRYILGCFLFGCRECRRSATVCENHDFGRNHEPGGDHSPERSVVRHQYSECRAGPDGTIAVSDRIRHVDGFRPGGHDSPGSGAMALRHGRGRGDQPDRRSELYRRPECGDNDHSRMETR